MDEEKVWECRPSASMILEQVDLLATDSLSKTISNVQAVGADEVNGGTTEHVYTYLCLYLWRSRRRSNHQQVKLWVSEKQGLPVKQRDRSEAGGIRSKTVQIIRYDLAITIKPPM
ncbi:hypothetical protein [Candidatus Amarolinea dominans]|uniref:hypothetical protein n=1 Tax=Candidatus Amarolinea dominans TaxID=3140696 RepID=UPI003136D7CD|nr:hypothetical protein [Anaerolineae bacterium]